MARVSARCDAFDADVTRATPLGEVTDAIADSCLPDGHSDVELLCLPGVSAALRGLFCVCQMDRFRTSSSCVCPACLPLFVDSLVPARWVGAGQEILQGISARWRAAGESLPRCLLDGPRPLYLPALPDRPVPGKSCSTSARWITALQQLSSYLPDGTRPESHLPDAPLPAQELQVWKGRPATSSWPKK